MICYPDTLVLPSPPFNTLAIDEIIFKLWNRHLDIEMSGVTSSELEQHLDVTAAVIDFWEEKLTEINDHEIEQRRLNSNKGSKNR